MARASAHRPPAVVRSLAVVVMVFCLGVVGWAVRGLVSDPVPDRPDFGSSTIEVEGPTQGSTAAPSLPGDSAGTTADPDVAPAPGRLGAIPAPGRSSAGLPAIPDRPAPVRLSVPSLDLRVQLDDVGVTADGQMEIPDEGDRAGWYRHGPAPGSDAGSVVVAGHVDTSSGPAAFVALTGVEEGAEVVVELDDGSSAIYRVVGGETVAKTDLAVDDLFRRDGDPVLRLVTCTGDWSPRAGSYTDNLVVTAVPTG